MACGHHRGVVFVFKCGVAKVDNFNVGILKCSLVSFLWRNKRNVRATTLQIIKLLCGTTFRDTHHIRVVLHIIVWVNEENVFRLQVSVSQLVSMQNWKKRIHTFKIIKRTKNIYLLLKHCSIYSQRTALIIWYAICLICSTGKGWKLFSLRKS